MADELNRKALTLEYAGLVEEREACNNQYRSTIDDAQKLVLRRKLDKLDNQIKILENKLYNNDLTKDNNHRSIALEEKLPKIDFKQQIKVVNEIFEQFVDGGAALFLLNDSFNMAGDLFCLELKKILEDDTTDFKHYEIAFSVDRRLDEIGFLQGLGDYLHLDGIKTREDHSIIIEKFSHSLGNGSIIFIELRKIDLLNNKSEFLSWLVDIFWKSFNDQLTFVCKNKDLEQIKIIIILSSDDDILDECLGLPFIGDEQCFSIHQIFPIILQDWDEKQIKLWLTKYSRLEKERITSMAKSIYKSSRGGTPKLICDALKNKLS